MDDINKVVKDLSEILDVLENYINQNTVSIQMRNLSIYIDNNILYIKSSQVDVEKAQKILIHITQRLNDELLGGY